MAQGDRQSQNDWVHRVLGVSLAGGRSGQPAAAVTGPIAYAKSRLAWLAARKAVENEIGRLHNEIVATFEADGTAARHASGFTGWVSPVLETFDTALADTLDAMVNEIDAARHAGLVAQAKLQLAGYQAFLSSPIIAELEQNPFTPISISKPVGDTLAALAATLR